MSDAYQSGAFQGGAFQIGGTPPSGGGGGINGSAAITLDAVTVSGAGNLPIAGAAAITLASVTAASAAKLTIDGDAAITLASVTVSSAAKLTIDGDASITLGTVTVASVGTLPIAGAAAITLGDVTVSATGAGASTPIAGTADITLGAVVLVSSATQGVTRPSGFDAGAFPAVQRLRDRRWDGVREAREEARRLFDEVPATPVARRKEAAVRASEAVAEVAKTISKPVPVSQPQSVGQRDSALDRLLELQAYLQGLIEQEEAIRAQQAREAAEMWAMIERELAAEAAREEELMIVFALVA